MSHGVHRRLTGHRGRMFAGLLGVVSCVGPAVGVSASASVGGARAVVRAGATSQLQYHLAGLGYLPWSGVDGQTGPQPRAATSAFQSDACIGVAGAQTTGALAAKVKRAQAVAHTTQDGAYGPHTRGRGEGVPARPTA